MGAMVGGGVVGGCHGAGRWWWCIICMKYESTVSRRVITEVGGDLAGRRGEWWRGKEQYK
eukprot:10881168-Prorocentrum_lima.AAC.1